MKIMFDPPTVPASFQPAALCAACGRPGAGLPARPRGADHPAAPNAPGQPPAIWPPHGVQDLHGYQRRGLGEDDAADLAHTPDRAKLRAEPGVAFRPMYLGPDDSRWPSLADPNPRGCGPCHYFLHRQYWVIYWMALVSRPRCRRAAHCFLPAPDRLHTASRLERDRACRRPLPIATGLRHCHRGGRTAPCRSRPRAWQSAPTGSHAAPPCCRWSAHYAGPAPL
jgi:hypothetical protein